MIKRWAAMVLALGALMAMMPVARAETKSKGHGAPWFAGTPAAAFAKAKAEKKSMLLYWGAVWCPPCNELKNEVLSKPRFAELMKPMIAVYLDGDEEDAQSWGERLKVSGYPTVLVLDSDGKEVWRLGTTLAMAEFEAALTSALKSGQDGREALKRAMIGQASDDDWRMLATADWSDASNWGLSAAELWQSRLMLAQTAPDRLKAERALLAGSFVESAAMAAQDDAKKAEVQAFVKEALPLIDVMLKDDASIKAARSPIIYSSAEIVGWAVPKGKVRNGLIKRWLAAAEVIRADPKMSIDTRLWSLNPYVSLFQLENEGPVPADLAKAVTQAAAKADAEAKSSYERHAVISGAASLLGNVGNYDAARKLLDKELKTTDTPWYYQSSYASVEGKAGNPKAALVWTEKARLSVKGRASRLQWIVEDLAATTKYGEPKSDAPRVEKILKEYYELAFALPDGFKGRNGVRADKVADKLKPWLDQGKIREVVKTYTKKCTKGGDQSAGCAKHFGALTTTGA